ncbi:glutathione S-transferase theta-1-like [Strongylocentrotus purpuratus]|uniref:GST C-terminal domain-containing protein n=1 Tax=Strongylocentrotus purpuratus TaxID=7668 RepID=A0A7M7P6A2_STRPU|nr:glutathione S-transferase theta-1-like [Strongylocentrotus purpuratus]
MVVKVYVDFRTQPSRSLVIFLKNTKIPFEIENIDLVGIPLFTGGKQHASEERLKTDTENLTKQLDKLENAFLQDNDWLAGDDISVADVLAVPEMMQNTVNGRDVTEGRPKLRAFVDRVKNRLNPVFD